jgi:photoactive yellow protein
MANVPASHFPFGLLELDSAGTVVRFTPAPAGGAAAGRSREVVGHKLFEDIAPVEELRRLKARFLAFMAFGDSDQRLDVTFPYRGFIVAAHILLTRLADRAELGGTRLALVRLMPDA